MLFPTQFSFVYNTKSQSLKIVYKPTVFASQHEKQNNQSKNLCSIFLINILRKRTKPGTF